MMILIMLITLITLIYLLPKTAIRHSTLSRLSKFSQIMGEYLPFQMYKSLKTNFPQLSFHELLRKKKESN